MKIKLFILFVLQMFSFSSFAQNSDTEFFKEGKVWWGRTMLYWTYHVDDFSVQVYGDTIVNDVKCKKMIRIRFHRDTHEVVITTPFFGYEKNGKIFLSYGDGDAFTEIIDFNRPLGDVDEYSEIIDIDTIEVNGIRRKRLTSKRASEYVAYVVEGIGYNDSALRGNLLTSYFEEILSVYEDGKCIFTQDDFKAPPITGIVNVKDTHSPENNAIYNLMGERVNAPVKGQIYIRNHKKFVVK